MVDVGAPLDNCVAFNALARDGVYPYSLRPCNTWAAVVCTYTPASRRYGAKIEVGIYMVSWEL